MHRRTAAIWISGTLLIVGCTTTSTPETAAPPDPTASETATPTEGGAAASSTPPVAVDYPAVLVEQFADPDFSVQFDITGSQELPAGTIPRTGAGAVVGHDSELWVVDDLSGLDGAHFVPGQQGDVFGPGAIIGPSATTAVAMATKLVDGTLYDLDQSGHWHENDASAPTTVPGYVFDVLRRVESFEVTESHGADAAGHVLLRPSAPVEYDLADLAMSTALADDAAFDTRILVDDVGTLVRVEVEMDAPSHDVSWSVAFDISGLGDIDAIEPPDATWESAASLDFGTQQEVELVDGVTTFAVGEARVDFDVPASWQAFASPDGALSAEPPGGVRVAFMSLLGEQVDIEANLRDATAATGIEVTETERTDVGGFPSLLGTGTHPGGFAMVHSQSLAGHVSLLTLWIGPASNVDVQRAQLTEVLQTVRLRDSESDVVPGRSLGDAELQRDTVASVTEVAADAAGSGCTSAEVLWTDVTGSHQGEWSEDWLVDACGDLQVLEITFVEAVQGGTDIAVGEPFRYATATAPRHHGGIGDDPALAARLLREQPWLIDPMLDLDEVDVSASVQRARFDGFRLHVLILGSSLSDRFDDFLDTVAANLAGGAVVLIDADRAAVRASNGEYPQGDLQDALDGAAANASPEATVRAFVTALHPGV